MDSLEQPPDSLENLDEQDSFNNSSGILKINRNEIEAIPINKQPKELQDLKGLVAYNVNEFEHSILKQVANNDVKNIEITEKNTIGALVLKETENERKIRIGEMTPFGTVDTPENTKSLEDILQKYLQSQLKLQSTAHKPKKNNVVNCIKLKSETDCRSIKSTYTKVKLKKTDSESEYFPSSESESELKICSKKKSAKKKKIPSHFNKLLDEDSNDSDDDFFDSRKKSSQYITFDDGIEENYQERLHEYEKFNAEIATDNNDFFHLIDGDYFKVPKELWEKLYKFQKIGIKWLWELHQNGYGGILGDEMGLGKTIQIIVFFGALYWSRIKERRTGVRGLGSSIIVCPATLLYQWVEEFHKWCPPIRIAILHETGVFKGKPNVLIREVWSNKGIIITTYNGLLTHVDDLLKFEWHYTILDEGHKIRNPNAKITIAVKHIKSNHRIIVSGSPIQNNLKELWSLFDFIFPSKLGTLPAFIKSFAIPITQGGYANATELQVATAYKCATILKDTIKPYLLRRLKCDIQSQISLPEKNEQVLFCRLTEEQKVLYKHFLDHSDLIPEIINGNCKVFVGISQLRTLCNHPDLFQNNIESGPYGHWKKSGKMIVVEALLKLWKKQGHRVLLFTQSVKMLHIFQSFMIEQNYSYLKLEGSTSISSRQPLINKFNQDPSIFIMILTTKVGGLGVNLIGADRVIIYDPDWNPATDLQARERAWRIGQSSPVTIYRLLTAGTIEEKMYHRQIFKQFLTNKVLVDPKQRRFFKSNYLYELFTLQDIDENGCVETTDLFAGTGSEIKLKQLIKERCERKSTKTLSARCSFTEEKIEAMKRKARELSNRIVKKPKTTSNENICIFEEFSTNKNTLDTKKSLLSYSNEDVDNKSSSVSMKEKLNESFCNNGKEIVNEYSISSCSKEKHVHLKKHDNSKIPYLIKCDVYKVQNTNECLSKKQDDYVLEKLFNKTGLKAAMRHDKIMESTKTEIILIENEAKKLAKKAIEELEASRAQCWEPGTGRLNWTGSRGTVKPKLLFNSKNQSQTTTSSSLIELMKKRNGLVEATNHEMEILNEIRQYLLENNFCVNTDQIVNKFRDKYQAEDTPLFKSLLSELCTFHRCSDKTGVWKLKEKYC
ncbi:DNA excision repair protein ERCC-6-like [Daktulosphaira vitifoliae]|uniref:DNA excision repair protein ERCC-6-like n=1 Tax=Daktulosphaira vitifoliae TaxID=58002 RepID=UPI0021AA374B|nr:DNA excision repair protein ERCC-6-like [Daktulosphaira vitifoliae]